MNQVYETHAIGMHRTFALIDDPHSDLPDPPDNFDVWNSFPEDFRDRIANQFTCGIDNEHNLMRDRIQAEYATARARQTERQNRPQRQRSRGGRN